MRINIDTIFDSQPTGNEQSSLSLYATHVSPGQNAMADRWMYRTEADSPGSVTRDLVDVFVNNWARGVSGLLTPVPMAIFKFTMGGKQIAGGVYENGSFALRKELLTDKITASLSIDRQTAIAHGFPSPSPLLNNLPS